MPEKRDEEQKEILKQALKEWMDERFAAFGRWTFYGFLVAAWGALAYLILYSEGWKKAIQ